MQQLIKQIGAFAAMLLAFFPVSAYDFEIDKIRYNITSVEEHTVEVSGIGFFETIDVSLSIPNKIIWNNKTYAVTRIGNNAFTENNGGLIEVTIPHSVTSIGECAFARCQNLKSMTIPESVTTIENSAFLYCTGMISLTIPKSVKTIGPSAFSECN